MQRSKSERQYVLEGAPGPEDEVLSPSTLLAPRKLASATPKLPIFSIGRYTASVASGLRKENERRDQERNLEEMRWKAYRDKQEAETTMFTTPGEVPLATPPSFNWITFERVEMKPPLLYEKLFPGDVAKQDMMKVVEAEHTALEYYWSWLHNTFVIEKDVRRRQFYWKLFDEVTMDREQLYRERNDMLAMATPLGRFSFLTLDHDGQKSSLEAELRWGLTFEDEDDADVQAEFGARLRQYPKVEREKGFRFPTSWKSDQALIKHTKVNTQRRQEELHRRGKEQKRECDDLMSSSFMLALDYRALELSTSMNFLLTLATARDVQHSVFIPKFERHGKSYKPKEGRKT